MTNREDDKLDVEKQIAGKLLRYAAKSIREAKSPAIAEATMRVAGQHLQALPAVLGRLMPDSTPPAASPEIVPPQLAELMKRRKGG